jgi:L,D-peptidoglycan transpeptidase YkuD (ErfK/YbiS/YcfS/YnhG family)
MPVRFRAPALACLLLGATVLAGCTSGADSASQPAGLAAPSVSTSDSSSAPASSTATSSAAATSSPRRRRTRTARPGPRPVRPAPPRRSTPPPSRTATPTPTAAPHPASAAQLPLGYPTGSARQAVTVVASARSDTQGTVQAWRRVSGGWRRVGPAVPAWLGSDGMTPHPSEQLSATPMGSYSLTRAFGYAGNPGTALNYTQTTPADWWISEPGPMYNSLQHCSSGCPFTKGDPNEHLYYTRPYYAYAAVIDYNTADAGPVRQGAGSAFFLHVAVGAPTAGCVAIDQAQLVRILRWLRPADHPRILIGTR